MQQRTRPLLCHSCAETDTEQTYKHVWLIICSEVLRRNMWWERKQRAWGRVGVGSGNPKLSKNRTFEERPERDKEANFTAI